MHLRLGFFFDLEGRFLVSACWRGGGGTGDTIGVTSEDVPDME